MWDSSAILKLASTSSALPWTPRPVDKFLAKMLAAWSKGNEALWVVEQLVNHGPGFQVTCLKLELRDMRQQMRDLEETLNKASKFVVELSSYVSNLPTAPGGTSSGSVPQAEFLAFKEAHAQLLASIRQELKGGSIKIGGIIFDSKDAYIAFAREHLMRKLT